MHRSGDDLSKKRRMNFAFVFQTERGARAFQPKAEALGFDVEVSFFASKRCWDAECSMDLTPTHKKVSSVESELSTLAAPDGGRPDGWGCVSQ
ncbi:MAG: hypothetical protein AD742_01715 [Methylibium sp. NZG]|nr:MAG: hypothetical protein AD742_01715 [Methylibium sp. NZG]